MKGGNTFTVCVYANISNTMFGKALNVTVTYLPKLLIAIRAAVSSTALVTCVSIESIDRGPVGARSTRLLLRFAVLFGKAALVNRAVSVC